MSKAFQFPLQRILKLKGKIEDSKAMHYMQTQADLNKQKQQLEDITAKKQTAMKNTSLTRCSRNTTSIQLLQRDQSYVEQLNKQIDLQEERVKDSEEVSSAALQDLVQAAKEKKVIEKLRERRLGEHKKHQRQKEIIEDSEVAGRMKRRESE